MLGRPLHRKSLPVLKGRGIDAAPESSREALPQGWIRVESRSKPGTFYYAHPATKRTQMERPVDPARRSNAAVPAPAAPAAPKKAAEPVEVVLEDEETAEEKQKREEERRAAEKKREEEEERERQEVLMRARERRAQERLEEERRRKEEEEQEEEERLKLAQKRKEKKQKQEEEKQKAESERLQKEAEEQRQKEMDELDKALTQTSSVPVAMGRRADLNKHNEAKWKKEASDDEEEITQEDLEKWKEDEERHEREEAEAKRRKIEEEERRKREAELEEQRKKAEFAAAVERARRMKMETDRQKQEELRKSRNSPSPSPPRTAASAVLRPGEPPPMQPQVPMPGIAPLLPAKLEMPSVLQQSFPAAPVPVVVPPPPPKPAPAAPTLANLLSGAVAKPDFGALLKTPNEGAQLGAQLGTPVGSSAANAANAGNEMVDMGPQIGTILWYNGRRKSGMLLADRDQRQLRFSALSVNTGNLSPPVPAGLMHGTRVSYVVDGAPGNGSLPMTCHNVRPLPGQSGLSCGGDSQTGPRLANEDRTIATDLQDSLGHMVGIFDGHRGTFCADYLAQEVPKMMVQGVREAFLQRLGSANPSSMDALSVLEEVELIRAGIQQGLEATDQSFLRLAQQYGFKDGASAIMAVVMHGFQTVANASTVPSAPGGQAKLFVAWSGTGHALLLRGRQVIRCSEDHVCNREEERRRLSNAGCQLVQDLRGTWWVGRPGNPELTWARQQCYEDVAGPKSFLAASRGFGDLLLKGPPYPVLSASPEVQVVDLCPEDWAIVIATRGVFAVLTDQDVANACWDAMAQNGAGPQEAAQVVTQRALQLGAKTNLTCIVMKLGWSRTPI